jgi:hypothetical protein
LREKVEKHVREYETKTNIMEGRGKKGEVDRHRESMTGLERSRITEVMVISPLPPSWSLGLIYPLTLDVNSGERC